MSYRVIFMGTPYFAQEVLRYLVKRNDLEVVAVVTQPDRYVGRKQVLTYPEVKEEALAHGIPVYQPNKVKDIEQDLRALDCDAIITCAYGQFLPRSILEMSEAGVINVHASLLPKYRGGAPIQKAIKQGDSETGISLMRSSLLMDAGEVFSQLTVSIDENDTLTSLELKLIEASLEILERDLIKILSGQLIPVPQNEADVSFAYTISASDELIDFSKEGREVYNHIRSLINRPYAYGYLDGKKIKFCEVTYMDMMHKKPEGTIIEFTRDVLKIALRNGILCVYELQVAGKQKMSVSQAYPGYHQKWLDLKVKSNA